MTQYQKSTDTEHTAKLASKLVTAEWVKKIACAGDSLPFEVWTQFVGNGADITLKVKDQKGKSVQTVKGKVYGNRFAGSVIIPEKNFETLTFTARLPKHGLEIEANTCRVLPPVGIINQQWDRTEARRGDVVKLTADTQNIADGEELVIMIYEYDRDGAHDFIAKFPCRVTDRKIEADWQYQYHEDTDEIPTEEEMQRYGNQYNPPEYFWTADFHGRRFGQNQESGLLRFKDWIEIELRDSAGRLISDAAYVLHLPDGTERGGRTDAQGRAREENLPPGPCFVTRES